MGPVIAPDDAGLEPIRAVHNTGMIEYLMTAYERQNAEVRVSTLVFPTFFPPSGQRRRPGCFEGLKGFYCTNTGVPIDEHTWKAAVASAHCAIAGARVLRSGESRVYALCRPPGHHTGPDYPFFVSCPIMGVGRPLCGMPSANGTRRLAERRLVRS